MNVQKFKLTCSACDDFEAEFEVDLDHPDLRNACAETNEFFSGSEDRLDDHEGDVVKAYFSLLARPLWIEAVRCYGILSAVLRVFDEGVEGFYPIDGTRGIKLVGLEAGIPESFQFALEAI